MKFLSACLVAAVALSACSKKGGSTAPESHAGGGAAPDDIDAFERELDLREQQLAALRGKPSDGAQGVGRDANARTRSELEKKAAADAGADMAEAQSGPAPTIAPTSTAPSEPPMRYAPQDRCTTVCELSTAICGLQDRICELAPRHPGEPRYQAACQRAARDCEASQEACHACA